VTTTNDLLRRIESDPEVAELLAWPADFDITRRPEEQFTSAGGSVLEPIAGCGGGGTYFLCGPSAASTRPVLYADSEGQATLIGEDLAETIALVVQFPFWRDLLLGHDADALESEYRADCPEYDEVRDRLMALLDIAPLTVVEAVDRLRRVAVRTAPDFVPTASVPGALPYRPLFEDASRSRPTSPPAR
jgi:hypothetical protein